MSRHQDPPGWFYAAGPASLLTAFLALAIASVIGDEWAWVAVGTLGILVSAATWILILNLREETLVLKGQAVRDAYEMTSLKADLRRARSWQN